MTVVAIHIDFQVRRNLGFLALSVCISALFDAICSDLPNIPGQSHALPYCGWICRTTYARKRTLKLNFLADCLVVIAVLFSYPCLNMAVMTGRIHCEGCATQRLFGALGREQLGTWRWRQFSAFRGGGCPCSRASLCPSLGRCYSFRRAGSFSLRKPCDHPPPSRDHARDRHMGRRAPCLRR